MNNVPPPDWASLTGFDMVGEPARITQGEVCSVQDEAAERSLRARMFAPTGSPEPDELERWFTEFEDEVRRLERAPGPVVRIRRSGRAGDHAWVISEPTEGCALAELIDSGPLPPELAAGLIGEIASALDRLHAVGTVHRALRPDTVMVREDGEVRFRDTVLLGRSAEAVLASTLSRDEMACVAPEVVMGLRQRPASNQHSLATIAYRMLAGCWPHDATRPTDYAYGLVYGDHVALSARAPELGGDVDEVFARAFAAQPDDRYETCARFADALRAALLTGGEAAVVPAIPVAQPETQPETQPEAETGAESESALGPVFQPEAVPEPEPEPRPEPEPEPETEPEVDVETEPEVDVETEPEVDVETVAEAGPEPDAAMAAEPAPEEPAPVFEWFRPAQRVFEITPEERPPSMPSPRLALTVVPDPAPEPEPEPADPEVELELEAEPELELQPEAELEFETGPELELQPEAGLDLETEPELEILPEPELEPELEIEADPAAEADEEVLEPPPVVMPDAELAGIAEAPVRRPLMARLRDLLYRLRGRTPERLPAHLMREAYLAEWRGNAAESIADSQDWDERLVPHWQFAVQVSDPGWLRVDGRYAGPAPAEVTVSGRAGDEVFVELMRDGLVVASTRLRLHPMMDKVWRPEPDQD